MDLTYIYDFVLQIVTKQNIIDMFARLGIQGYADIHLFGVWVITNLVLLIILFFITKKVLSFMVNVALEGGNW